MQQHPELHIQLLLAQATLSDKAYGSPSVTREGGTAVTRHSRGAELADLGKGKDSLLIWLLHSSGWTGAARDSWAHKTGDSSSRLGKLSPSLQKHFSMRSGNQKWAQRTLRERRLWNFRRAISWFAGRPWELVVFSPISPAHGK